MYPQTLDQIVRIKSESPVAQNRTTLGSRVGCLLMVLGCVWVTPTLLAQGDVRAFRAPNHLLVAARSLRPDEPWQGLSFKLDDTRYGILKWGAGCFVSSDGLVLTANHVVTGADYYFVGGWSQDKAPVLAEVLKRDEKNDLALLRVTPPTGIAWIRRAFATSSAISEGQGVFLWAYLEAPGAFLQFLRSGIVSNNEEISGIEHQLYVEATAVDGTSGSPVFLRNDGQPIGIVSSKITLPGGSVLPAGIIGIIPGEKINGFLRDYGVAGF